MPFVLCGRSSGRGSNSSVRMREPVHERLTGKEAHDYE